ncbi:unnamed protein product [Adineta ricciae]|uniref:Uncharacterized protein n=1 Tax=Adineta ricciae TaxID=249248 RepID=A0A816F8E7_ADIRI|nr:unnamed protein product [Adineta ricciae]
MEKGVICPRDSTSSKGLITILVFAMETSERDFEDEDRKKQSIGRKTTNVYSITDRNDVWKIQEVRKLKEKALENIKRIKNAGWGNLQKTGFTAEKLHELTFNLDAIRKGSPIRAYSAKYGNPNTDIELKDTSKNVPAILSTAQLKFGSKANVATLGNPKYSQVDSDNFYQYVTYGLRVVILIIIPVNFKQ